MSYSLNFDQVTTQTFEKIVLPIKDKLYRFAMSLLKNEDDAKDVVQDVLIKTWEDLNQSKAIKNTEAWCMTLVKNRSLDKLKKKGRNHEDIGEQFQLRVLDADPLEQTVMNDRMKRIGDCIARLPEKQSQILTLRDVEGYSYKEIAEIMEIKMDHVKVLLHRGRMSVRKELKGIESHG